MPGAYAAAAVRDNQDRLSAFPSPGSISGGTKALSSSGGAMLAALRKVWEPACMASSFQMAISSQYCCRSMGKLSILSVQADGHDAESYFIGASLFKNNKIKKFLMACAVTAYYLVQFAADLGYFILGFFILVRKQCL